MLNSLSGRFLVLTIVFVMLAEILIFVPSIARFREDYLLSRLERAQIASLALLADEMIDADLEVELLQNAEVFNIVLLRDEMRQLILSSPIPAPISDTYDLRDLTAWQMIRDSMKVLITPTDEIIRVIGAPTREAGLLIEVTMEAAPLRAAMLDYGVRILALSAVISVFTASLLFFAVRRLLVAPIRGVINHVTSYAAAPEDARRIITPNAGVRELREAEEALQSMQTQLTSALRQKDRLAQLGGAVAKVSHDLRNILTTASLLADRMEVSKDPMVRRAAPKLMGTISRAVNLCEGTLAFGRAEEPPPNLTVESLSVLVDDVLDGERLAVDGPDLILMSTVSPELMLRCDPDQVLRVLGNLIRNARQALEASGGAGQVTVDAGETADDWWITVQDTGPGLPKVTRDNLFTPFQGGVRKGGAGLGLAIAAELVRGHGGTLALTSSGSTGTTFTIRLPKGDVTADAIFS